VAGLVLAAWPSLARADVTLAPGPHGGLGALLVAGPIQLGTAGKRAAFEVDAALPEGGDSPRLGEVVGEPEKSGKKRKGPAWSLLAAPGGTLDLAAPLKARDAEATAVAGCVLRVSQPFQGFLSLAVDDGVAVYVDGKKLHERDEARAPGEDDDLVPLTLAPGDHTLLLKLHQRGGAWTLRLRLTDEALAPARDVRVVLPGVDEPASLAGSLLSVSLDRGLTPTGLAPRVEIGVAGGYPDGADRHVRIRASVRATRAPLFDVDAGEIPVEATGPAHSYPIFLPEIMADETGGEGEVAFEVKVGPVSREFTGVARKGLREVLAHAARVTPVIEARPAFLKDPDAALATVEYLSHRLLGFAARHDPDVASQLDEARAFDGFLDAIDAKTDPFLATRGARRVAYRSPLDGKPSPFGLYLPPKFDPTRRYPLVVALHGLNGKPLNMMRWLFGQDDPGRDGEWEDRHLGALPEIDGIVITPMAHFNSLYRLVGEEDVVSATEWAKRNLPVDPDKVSITGPSMGGTGTAWVAFRYPDRFAAAAPLCGYHSYFLRGDMAGKKRPWETAIAEDRSTVSWAPNGLHLPLYIVHGKKDLPMENSGVLIDRYKALGYSLLEEHPDEGHNVWQPTYEDLKGYRWLTGFKRPAHPSRLVFRTDDLRYDRDAWLRVRRLERSLAWGEVKASMSKKSGENRVEVSTSGVLALSLDRDAKLLDDGPVAVTIDAAALRFDAGEALDLEKRDGHWQKGIAPPAAGLHKGPRLAGPLRDVHHEPLVVVYGTADPRLARANEEVARWFASIKPGFEIDYPILADTAYDPEAWRGHALALVGGPGSNLVTRRLDDRLPIHVLPGEVRAGAERFEGEELGAAFVYPNPDNPGHYVAVIAGASVPGTLRAMSLPDLLPDFVVYDRGLARARHQMILGRGTLLAGGMFDESWALPPGAGR
jgi:predicted esterase